MNGRSCTSITRTYARRREQRSQATTRRQKALWKMRAARGRGEDFYDPARKDNILGRNKTPLELSEEHLKNPIAALDRALNCLEDPY